MRGPAHSHDRDIGRWDLQNGSDGSRRDDKRAQVESIGLYCCRGPYRASSGGLNNRAASESRLADFVGRITKIEAGWFDAIYFDHAQMPAPLTS